MLLNSEYNENQVEAEREGVLRSQVEVSRDQMETTLENLYYTSYRDHQMGQPSRGNRDNVNNVTAAQVRSWVDSHCVGKNLVVVATGDVEHADMVG